MKSINTVLSSLTEWYASCKEYFVFDRSRNLNLIYIINNTILFIKMLPPYKSKKKDLEKPANEVLNFPLRLLGVFLENRQILTFLDAFEKR